MEPLDVIPLIKREMKRQHLTMVKMARKLEVQPPAIKGMLSRPTLQVQKLAELSELFNYNFFREVAQMLPYTEPDYSVNKDAEAKAEAEKKQANDEKDALKDRIRVLEIENTILRQTLKDVISR